MIYDLLRIIRSTPPRQPWPSERYYFTYLCAHLHHQRRKRLQISENCLQLTIPVITITQLLHDTIPTLSHYAVPAPNPLPNQPTRFYSEPHHDIPCSARLTPLHPSSGHAHARISRAQRKYHPHMYGSVRFSRTQQRRGGWRQTWTCVCRRA